LQTWLHVLVHFQKNILSYLRYDFREDSKSDRFQVGKTCKSLHCFMIHARPTLFEYATEHGDAWGRYFLLRALSSLKWPSILRCVWVDSQAFEECTATDWQSDQFTTLLFSCHLNNQIISFMRMQVEIDDFAFRIKLQVLNWDTLRNKNNLRVLDNLTMKFVYDNYKKLFEFCHQDTFSIEIDAVPRNGITNAFVPILMMSLYKNTSFWTHDCCDHQCIENLHFECQDYQTQLLTYQREIHQNLFPWKIDEFHSPCTTVAQWEQNLSNSE